MKYRIPVLRMNLVIYKQMILATCLISNRRQRYNLSLFAELNFFGFVYMLLIFFIQTNTCIQSLIVSSFSGFINVILNIQT